VAFVTVSASSTFTSSVEVHLGAWAGLAERVRAATEHELAEQTRLRLTDDFKEGVKAMAERRVPNFTCR